MRRQLAILSVLLVAAAVLSACTEDLPVGSTDTTAVGDMPDSGILTNADPLADEVVEIVEQALPELDLQTVLFGVWVGDEEIARGALDASAVQPATSPDARVRVGQPMEAMLATILLQLGSEGVIDLDASVAEYVPDLANADLITPRMLANSTGGTPDYVRNTAFQDRVAADPFAGYTFDELLDFAQQSPPLFEPGTSWAYSHTEMAVLVEVLERASGESLQDLMASRIFEPLGMTASSAHRNNEISEPVMHAFTNARGVYEDSTFWDPTWGLNGGMNASVVDLARWLRALNAGELLDTDEAEEILSPVTVGLGTMTEDRYFAYGSMVQEGWILGNPNLNGYMGFTAQQRDPSVTIVVWTTAAPGNAAESNASQAIAERIAAILSDTPFEM